MKNLIIEPLISKSALDRLHNEKYDIYGSHVCSGL